MEAKLDETHRERPDRRPEDALGGEGEGLNFGAFGASMLAAVPALIGGIYVAIVSIPHSDGRGTMVGVGWIVIGIGHLALMRQRNKHDTRPAAQPVSRGASGLLIGVWVVTAMWLLPTIAFLSR